MKRTAHIVFGLIAAVLTTWLVVSCGVTETGNPTQTPTFAEPQDGGTEAGDAAAYENDAMGISIALPTDWSYEEAADGMSVTFFSPDDATGATFYFDIIDPPPASLFAYLFEAYPSRTFTVYITGDLTGYVYDDPAAGEGGGDLREYFFLDGDLLIRVVVELAAPDEAAFLELLEGISIM